MMTTNSWQKKSAVKCVIFDMDGVIVETVPYHFAAWKEVFAEEGIKLTRKDYMEKLNGIPRDQGVINVMGNISKHRVKKIGDRKLKLFLKMFKKKKPKTLPGIRPLLKKLRQKGLRLAAASSSKNAPFILRALKVTSAFDVIVKGDDFKRSKPHPDIFAVASKRLGCPAESVIVIEDAAVGIKAAKQMGALALGLGSSEPLESLKQAGADVVVKTPRQLARAIQTIIDSRK